MDNSLTIGELFAEISKKEAFTNTADHPNYRVVSVLNPDSGPDEVIQKIINISWDHQLQVLRLEIE